MTELLRDVETPSDAELISRVRGGDVTAYGDLFSRHKTAANRLARQLVRGLDSDDLVAEAFAKVLNVLQAGGGPDVAFRAYLLTAVRRLHIDRVRSGQRLQTTDDLTPFDPGVPFKDTAVAGFERGAAAKAFASLPERWQLVLWHLEVEGQKPADIAPLLGMSANSVSALAYRAREGLRQAFLTMHLSDTSDTECRWVNEHLGAFVRKGLSKRDATKVQKHLDGCRRCSATYLELDDVNSNLAGIIAPLLLGAAAAGYLASSGAGAAVGVLAAFSKAKEVVVANSGAAAAAGIASAVAAAAVIAVVVTQGGPSRNVVADPPAVTSSAPSGATGSPSSLASPSTAPSAGASLSASGATATASPGAAGASATPTTATTTPSFSLGPLPVAVPVVAPVTPVTPAATTPPAATPTATAAPSATASSSATPTTPPASPGASPTAAPGTGPPSATPARVVGHPVLHADGTVSVAVRHARATDTVEVTLSSQETTFRSTVGIAGCRTAGSRRVVCRADALTRATVPPRAPEARALVSTGVTDVSMRLPLAFPDAMVTDDVEVTASVRRVSGASATSGRRTFRPARVPRFDFVAPVLGSPLHTLAGDEDRYGVATTAVLPPRVTGLVYTLSAPAHFQAVAGCRVGAAGRTLRCPNVGNGDRVTLPLAATGLTTGHQVSVRVTPVDRFVDPVPGNNTAALTLRPGVDLGLSLAPTSADSLGPGLVALSGHLTGLRPGLGPVTYTVTGASFPAVTARLNPGCTATAAVLTCPVGAGGDPALTVLSPTPTSTTQATVSVAPSAPFEAVGLGPHQTGVTLPDHGLHDFSLKKLDVSDPAVVGLPGATRDHYTLTGTVGALPVGVTSLAFTVSGSFVFANDTPAQALRDPADQQHGCVVGALSVSTQTLCAGVDVDGQVTLVVESAWPREPGSSSLGVTVTIQPAASFTDPDATDDTATVTLAPGIDLALTPLTEVGSVGGGSAANVDDDHVVSSTLSGVRAGMESITYALADGNDATLEGVGGATCEGAGSKTLTCQPAANGDVSFRVASKPSEARAGTPITITASSPRPFVELDAADNAASTTLAARPSYDFALGPVTLGSHTVSGDADLFTLSSTVKVPASLDEASFTIVGGTFVTDQPLGCSKDGERQVTCRGLTDSSAVALHVSSTSATKHPVTLTLEVPTDYRDPSLQNNDDSVEVTPGVDLHLGALTPADPVPTGTGDYQVAGVLTGVRSGPVTFTVSGGAAVKATSCSDHTATQVTCAGPTNGQKVSFTLTATKAAAATRVTITAAPGGDLEELHPSDNSQTSTLAPDVAITSLTRRPSLLYTAVRVQVTGVPAGVSSVRLHLSGPDVGLARLRFVTGESGADGEGDVDCYTSTAAGGHLTDGVDVSCVGVDKAGSGSFYIDTRLSRPPLTSTDATFTVRAVGADEGAHGDNNSRSIHLTW